AYIAAGLTPVRGQRAPEDERRYPVRVKTDELAYPGQGPDPEATIPFNLRLAQPKGSNLGRFHAEAVPMDDYRQEQDAKRRQAEAISQRLAARKAARKGEK
ncbi:hypothetical protein ADL27_50635, partial [Streptomyces sp. NRRL F-6602]